ncbi:restriction endonuclease subunit S [Bifidobacterium apousia]|uniref:restriction endonuclease subunit S n=1 Tax=Bifidobacterium apousia TaxID=2750996 RepID=UPI0018DD7428|nr:restriction endonuclease subunit S [Bifidobacterium apousia]MBI0063200.1 restriction endonuclease subunit S [Bifidobacterium apousia]
MKQPMLRFKADDGSDFPDWEEKTLGNEGRFYGGLSGKDKKDFETGDACFVTYMNVYKNPFARQDMMGCVSVGAGEKQNKVLYGDLLFTQSSETVEEVGLSSVYLHDDEPYLNSFCMGYRFNNPKEVCHKFIGYCMRSDRVRKSIMPMGQGISRINLSSKRLGTVSFHIPSLPEQRKIADLLSTVDNVIAAQQAEVDAWKQRKKGAMQKLFSQEVRFKADDGSDFPDWEEKTLGELCAPLTYGMNAAATRFDGENRYIRITDIDDETHAYLSDDVVSPEGHLDDKYIVGNGDILLARTGASTGKSYLYHSKDGKLFYAGFLIKAHVLSSSDDYFVYSQTLTDKYWKWVKMTSMRSGQPGINANEYASYSFAVPSLPEQHKIADCLSSIDDVIVKARAELTKWQELKKGLVQQMFV